MNICSFEEDLLFLTNISYCLGSNFLPHCLNQDIGKNPFRCCVFSLEIISQQLPKALSAEFEEMFQWTTI